MSAHGYVQVGEQHPEEPSAKKDAPPQLLRPTKSKAEQIAAIKAKVRRSTTVTSVPQTVMLLMTMFHCSLRPCKTKLMRTPSKPLVSAATSRTDLVYNCIIYVCHGIDCTGCLLDVPHAAVKRRGGPSWWTHTAQRLRLQYKTARGRAAVGRRTSH
eukprot:COSAG01_NODE_8148_length_2903_cov_2.324893_4_plen_156_part_00